uniref:Serpin domain-containing protein n=1 Tax=Oncorhynchus mykiss TaxID=8022 RepID=A0A8C7SSA6_ONCMY
MASISSSNTAFALELYRTLGQTNTGNVFISPFSISSALAMVYLGAKGDTAAQMAKVLSFNLTKDIHTDFQTLNGDINSPSASYILKLANRLYGEKTCNFLTEFLESTHKFYHADMKAVDFLGAAEEARGEINGWVEQYQNYEITHMESCSNQKSNESKPVQMMHQMKKFPFNYVPDYNLQIVELPYVDEELSMFVLLPEEATDGSDPLVKLERELTMEKLDEWTSRDNMDTGTEVIVHLPKFKLEEDYELNKPLTQLGMKDVFDGGRADLSGMNGEGGLFLSKVAHKAFVEVNEEGTEAAAATAGIVAFCMIREEHFTADHPFLFFIRHNKSKSILFLGRFSSPQ